MIREAEVALADFSEVLEKVNRGEGSIGKLLNTSELHDELNKTVIVLRDLLDDLEANPNRYVHFSLFGRKVKGFSTSKDKQKILEEILDSLQQTKKYPDFQ